MLHRIMRAAFAVLVSVAFGCMPALSMASPANESPPLDLVALATAMDQLEETGAPLFAPPRQSSADGMGDLTLPSTVDEEAPAYPLRE